MSVREHDWMGQILGVTAPWQVTDVRVQPNTGIVSVQIEQPEPMSRFWLGRRNTVGARKLRWDHIGIAGHRCEVILIVRTGQKVPEASWVGEADMPFTRGLSRLVLDLLLEGVGMSQLCRMLELPFSDLWKYKYRIDQGQAPQADKTPAPNTPPGQRPTAAAPTPGPTLPAALAAASTPPAAPAAKTANVAPEASRADAATAPVTVTKVDVVLGHEASIELPPADAAIWLSLLKGKLALDVQALSLKLLLTKTLREAQQHNDPDLHSQAAQALHRYFERNRALLGHEIHQLAAAHHAHLSTQKNNVGTLPDASDPLWLALLTGEKDLDVRALGLRLLLSRLRGQTRQLQNDEARMLKLVELHRFFEKNQAMLRHEISQLQRWVMH